MGKANIADLLLATRREFTPKSGFNVVCCDHFELPGEGCYSIGHFDDLEAAKAAAKAHPQDDPVIYGTEGPLREEK